MHGALVGADPAQLAVAGQMPPELSGMREDIAKFGADDQMFHGIDRRAADFIAAADRKRQPVARKAVRIGIESDVGRRVIRIGVHRVRTIQAQRGGEAQVKDAKIGDAGHGFAPEWMAASVVNGSWPVRAIPHRPRL